MKKPTFSRIIVMVFVFLLVGHTAISQTYKPFDIRKNIDIRGSMLVIGNATLGKDNADFNDTTKDNQDISMQYIDIDNDASTFSSSSADIEMPPQRDGSSTTCYRVAYAGLYWGAVLQNGSRSEINKVKFKIPGSSTYTDIQGELIYDAIANPIVSEVNEPGNTPYASYADVTELLSGLTDIEGTYTVANVTSSTGFNNSTGLSAGWTLFIIYEDPNLHTKSFTTFDGFSHIYSGHKEEIPVTGFRTPQSGHIDLQFAYAALDGDRTKRATKLIINSKEVTTPLRSPANRFFGSVIENRNGVSTPRHPFSDNTLGYDTGTLEVLNSEPQYIRNDATSASFTLQVAPGQADPIFTFFSAFAVDIISPNIDLLKIVSNESGKEIDGEDVVLGQKLFYEISYQSNGNDDVKEFTITDVLPDNILFNPDTDIDLSNAGGAVLQSYDPVTRTLVFSVPNTSVESGDPKYVIRLAVQVVPNCLDLRQACSNEIINQAFATYTGIISAIKIEEQGSYATIECFGSPQPTNFLVDISNCNFQRTEVLCGASVLLTAADGYDTYSWSKSPTGLPVIGTGQSFEATEVGTYYVTNTTSSTCISIEEIIEVELYGSNQENPVIPFVSEDELSFCPDDGKALPNIFLCGANASREILTGISDDATVIWQKLDETSCAAVTDQDCANEDTTCTWDQVGTGPNFTANISGQFRLVITYPNGCYNMFYFNVYQNLLNPTATATDIICDTLGSITVGGVPNSGYEYSIDGITFQESHIFPIDVAGYYSIYVKQVGVETNPCIFKTNEVYVRDREVTMGAEVEQPDCNIDKGSIHLTVNNALAQYYYSIYQSGTLVNSVGPISDNDYKFEGLNPGTYTATAKTDDGCIFSEEVTIVNPDPLTATAAITKPLTCTDGEITVSPEGGTPPYLYYVNGSTDSQDSPVIPVSSSGVYDIIVVDSNQCSTEVSIAIDEIPAPEFTVTSSDMMCYNSNTGEIRFDVTKPNGYTVTYSIDNGVSFTSIPEFLNLGVGTYTALIKYAIDGSECLSDATEITLTQADDALTASAGVSELAGCGPSGEGKVRVTNPQGGTPPYQYSFDNQNWGKENEFYVSPGTYTLYIKDANGCIYPMPGIILDPKPVAPIINAPELDFNCDGTASANVSIVNPESSTYSYTYLLNGEVNPNGADSKTFLNLPPGNHTISVQYKLEDVPTYSNLLFETFGYGEDTTSPGINTQYYCFERQVVETQCNGAPNINDGDYAVTSEVKHPFGTWLQPGDHTPNPNNTPKGRALVVNIGDQIPVTAILYEKEINDIIPNQPIIVDFYAINLLKFGERGFDPNLLVALVDDSGNEISSFVTGDIPKSNQWENYATTAATNLNPGNNTTLKFILRSNVRQVDGNDVAIDDIKVYQLPKSCITQVDFPIIVEAEKAFKADVLNFTDVTCFGGVDDGSITISAQNFVAANGFQYSLDGTTWETVMTSPHTIPNLAAGNYNIQVRYDNTENTCIIPLTQEIKAPSLLEVTATSIDATCLVGGTITATASGGSPAFTYELLDASSVLIKTFPANGILTNVPEGNYIVSVTDVNGCTATVPLEILAPLTPTATIDLTSDYCYDATNGATLVVTAADGLEPYQYNINGGAFTTNNTFSGLTPGNYTIIVRDANGCEVELPTETIANQLTLNTVIAKDLDCTISPEGIITGTISGGYAPYSYEVAYNGGAFTELESVTSPFTYTVDTEGTYQFQITDDRGCTTLSDVITINPIENPTATTTVLDATCFGATDGSVQIVPSGGVGPYTYSFEGSNFTSTSLYFGLAAGTYTYQVKDSNDCLFDGTVTITEPTALEASASVTTAFSCDANNTAQPGVVTIDIPTTGTAPYTYSFNGSAYTATNTLSVNDNGANQTITYSVKDANGCTAGGSVSISPLNGPTDLDFSATAVTCNDTESKVTLTATNGVGVLSYEIISPIAVGPQALNVFTGLLPDTYVFKVTDENGCYYTESLTINPVINITVSVVKLSDVLCYGDNTGAIQFTVANTTGFTYTINGGVSIAGTSPLDINDLIAGDYTIIVTDTATGCTATETITITQPAAALGITAVATNVHCNEYQSQITVTATNGTPNYTYAAVISGNPAPSNLDYSANNPITVDTNLGADLVWDVYVKDANGCIETTTVTIVSDELPTIEAPTVDNQCDVNSGFTFTVSGTGIAPLQYSINGGASYQDSPTFTVNAAGTYTVTIKDGNGCTATSSTNTQVFEPITVNALLTKDLTCSDPEAATIEITASGGKAPYSYEVSTDGGATYTSISGSPYTTTIAGTYQFRITDANGCEKITNEVIVNPAVNPEITAVVITQDINCSGEETGAINITIDTSLGLAPFVINVFNTTTGINYGTQTSGLAAGNYTITVTDAKGCTDTETITIVEPDPIDFDLSKVDITCNNPGGSELGSITIENVSGGTGPFTYYITNNFGDVIAGNPYSATTNEDHTFDIINYGIYTINVIDAKGCSLQKQITIASPPSDLQIDIQSTVIDCASGGTATIEAISSIGSGNYEFGILEFNTPPYTTTYYEPDTPGKAIKTFTNLIPGVVYTFVVHDITTDCYYVKSADEAIPPSSPLTSKVVPNNVTCLGENNGSVTFTIDNFDSTTTSVDYQIFTAYSNVPVGASNNVPVTFGTPVTITTPSPGTLAPGQYYIVFSENGTGTYNGCESASVIFEIRESAVPLEIDVLISKNENCNELGVMSATGSNGTAPYQYQVVVTGATPDSTGWGSANTFNLPEGTYDVYVMDAYGCAVSDTQTIIRDTEPTIDPVAQQCFNGTPFTITLTGTTFNGEATYSIGGAYQSSPNFTITAAGTYTISIKDANGCIATETLKVEPPLLLDAVLDLDLTCDVEASITLSASGGTGIYNTYQVSSDGGATYSPIGSTTFTTTTDGTYIFMVTDSQGCVAISNSIIVTPNTTPILTHIQTDVSCNGGADGSIIVTADNGLVPYQYSINGGPFQSSNEFSGLIAGTYDIVVRDSKNCSTGTTTVTIKEPTLVDGTMVITQGLTCGAGNATQPATVTITGSGGTPPYTYSFDGINYTSTNIYKTFESGTVTAYVKDANGCIIDMPEEVVIPALSVPTDLEFTSTTVTCLVTESEVSLTTTGGVGALTYEIISPASATGNTTGATTGVFTNLAPDTYVFTVTDENGCYYTEGYTVAPVSNITVSGSLEDDVNCNAGNDGAVTFVVGNFSGTYSYEINNSGTIISGQTDPTINLTGLSAGDQTIVVTDETTGCTATFTVTVSEPTEVSLVETANINANCNFGAQVTVEASGGTPPYQYAFVLGGSAPITSDYTNSNTAVLDPATSINWDVWVMDSNGCTDLINVVIATDPLPTADVPTFAINQCVVTSGFEFTVTNATGIAPLTYSIGNGFQTSPTFTVSAAGTYTVVVKDGNGCTNAIPLTIDIYPALDQTPNVTALASCDDNDGEITVTAVGGSGTYTYSISPNPASIILTGNIFSGVPSGTYTVTVEDTVTGCTEDTQVTLEIPTLVDFTLTPTAVTCFEGTDGTITVNLESNQDNPIYTYAIIDGPESFTAPAQNSNVFTGLAAGTYTVRVISGRDCDAEKEVTIYQPFEIQAIASVEGFACVVDTNSTTFASITVDTETGGSGTYTKYEFIKEGVVVQSSVNNVYTETDLLGGTYTINVYDDNGCVGTTTATILPFISIDSLEIDVQTAITCPYDETIKVIVNSTGETPTNLEFVLEGYDPAFPTQTNNHGVFTGLIKSSNPENIASYKITVTNLDTGCTLQTVHDVNDPDTFDLTIDAVVDVTCFDAADGSVNVTFIDRLADKAGPFSYTVTDALGVEVKSDSVAHAGPITISGLASGTYTISASLTNSPFCTVDKNFTITAPTAALEVFETHTEITCFDNYNDGSILASAAGGWSGGYEYQLSLGGVVIEPFSSNRLFTNLIEGNYTVTVRDRANRGCEVSEDVELTDPLPIVFTAAADVNLLTCFGDTDATITATLPTGGQGGNYMYTLNRIVNGAVASSSGPQTSSVFSGLGAGTYTVTVTDGFNCSATSADIIIEQPTAIQANLVAETTATCDVEATLTLSATGGTGPYSYSTSSTFANIIDTFPSSTTFSVSPGTYKYYVRDANGCVAVVSNEIKIDPVPDLEINLTGTNIDINCFGDNNGAIVAKATGGLGGYIYTLLDASQNPIPEFTSNTTGVFNSLIAGTYYVSVDSGDCDEISDKIEIRQPDAPLTVDRDVFDVSCFGGNDGKIVVNATSSGRKIKYAISPQLNQFFDSNVFENLYAGDYQIIVQDEMGCFEILDVTVGQPQPLVVSHDPSSILPEICEGDTDGMFSITISGGTGIYSVSLDDYNGTYTTGTVGQTQFDFTGLKGGNHTVYVRDENGCESELDITFPESVRIDPEVVIAYLCENNVSGNSVTVNVHESITDLSELDYSLNDGPYQPSNVFENVVPGIGHYIDVRHSNGCIIRTELFDIVEVAPLELGINDGDMNQIVAVATGGTGDYTYTLNGEDMGSTSTFIIRESGDYTVTVTDSSGCIATATGYFEYIDICIPNYFTPNGDNVLDTWAPGCSVNYPNLEFKIFDRYGREVGSYRQGQSWDGKYRERELPTGDYWYLVKLNDGIDDRDFVGHFTLYR